MGQSTKRIIVDILLVGLLVFEMLYLITGDLAHEIVGALFFICLGLHLHLSRKMAAGLFAKNSRASKGDRRKKVVHRTIDILLFATIGALLFSSVLISNILIGVGFNVDIGTYGLWALVHTVSAYALCVIVVFHGALHWTSLFKGMKVRYDPNRRQAITSVTTACAALGTIALGVASADTLKDHIRAYATEREMLDASTGTAGSDTGGDMAAGRSYERNDVGSSDGKRSSSQRPSTDTKGPSSSGSGSVQNGSSGSERGSSQNGSSSSGGDSVQNDASNASGDDAICPLCRKRCSLSAPRCDKPYQAGLL